MVRSFVHPSPLEIRTPKHRDGNYFVIIIISWKACVYRFLKLMYVVVVYAFGVTTVRWLLLPLLCCTVFAVVYCAVLPRSYYLITIIMRPLFLSFLLQFWTYEINKISVRRHGIEDASIDLHLSISLGLTHTGLGLYTHALVFAGGNIRVLRLYLLRCMPFRNKCVLSPLALGWFHTQYLCVCVRCAVHFVLNSRMCIYVVCSSVVCVFFFRRNKKPFQVLVLVLDYFNFNVNR